MKIQNSIFGLGSNIGLGLFVGWVDYPDIFCWVSFLYPTYLSAIFVLSAKPNKMAEELSPNISYCAGVRRVIVHQVADTPDININGAMAYAASAPNALNSNFIFVDVIF
jgi:hypothetical protein